MSRKTSVATADRRLSVPESEWVWCGYAGHFCAASSCLMHMNTRVGDYRISTVGDYRDSRTGKQKPIGAGADSLYETFVFRVSGEGQHGEGEVDDWGEIDSERYATAEDAERGHIDYCRKYAAAEATKGDPA